MHIFKYLLRSHQLVCVVLHVITMRWSFAKIVLFLQGKRYYKRVIKILAIYTDLELCSSIRGNEYDKTIAERLVLIYQTYLDVSQSQIAILIFFL